MPNSARNQLDMCGINHTVNLIGMKSAQQLT